MNLTNFNSGAIKLGLLAVLATGLMAAQCEKNPDVRWVLERMPTEYRQCAAVAVPEINRSGPVTQKDLIRYTAKLKQYGGEQNRCLKGAVSWADAQWSAYNKNVGK